MLNPHYIIWNDGLLSPPLTQSPHWSPACSRARAHPSHRRFPFLPQNATLHSCDTQLVALQHCSVRCCSAACNEDRQLAILAGHDNDVMYQLDLEFLNLDINTLGKLLLWLSVQVQYSAAMAVLLSKMTTSGNNEWFAMILTKFFMCKANLAVQYQREDHGLDVTISDYCISFPRVSMSKLRNSIRICNQYSRCEGESILCSDPPLDTLQPGPCLAGALSGFLVFVGSSLRTGGSSPHHGWIMGIFLW